MSDIPVDGTQSPDNSYIANAISDSNLDATGEAPTIQSDVESSIPDPYESSEGVLNIPPSHGTQVLGGIGRWATSSASALQTPYPHTIPDDLLYMDNPIDEPVPRQSSLEEPFSLMNPVDCDSHVPNLAPRFQIRRRAVLSQTTHTMLDAITRKTRKMAKCDDHVESVCDPGKHRRVETRLNELLFLIVVAMATTALVTVGTYGMRLSLALVYFFLMLFAAVLTIVRLLSLSRFER